MDRCLSVDSISYVSFDSRLEDCLFSMKKEYLFIYNMVQWGGWLMIFSELVQHPFGFSPYVYIFQLLAILEVAHAILGIVGAKPATTAIQVFGRLQVLLFHYKIAEARDSSGNLPMVLAWSLVEIVRYLYLSLNLINAPPEKLRWLRYSLFYVLYPLGVYGEMKVLYDALPGIDRSGLGSVHLPNVYNLSFSLGLYVRLFLVAAYPLGLWNQYTYMIKQRRIVLAKAKSE